MQVIGKILFFNESEGKGILITSQREKISFNVEDWDDFDVMPSLGLEVTFVLNNEKASGIVSKSSTTMETTEININTEEYVDNIINDITETDKVDADDNEVYDDEVYDDEDDDDSKKKGHFEADPTINIIEDMQSELEEPREESITVTLNLSTAVANYFAMIKEHINRRIGYKKVKGRLNYIVARRFIWTTFNNLTEIDLNIVTPRIKSLSLDLKIMSSVYNDFNSKTKYPQIAFEEVFLSCQAEYKKIREGAEYLIERINLLQHNEKVLDGKRRVKKEELDKKIKSEEFDVLKNELKSLNGAYVDVVHMMAELDEKYKNDLRLLHAFEQEYREDFYQIFAKKAKEYKKDLLEIMDAQAYIVDSQLWQEAKKSKLIKIHFKKSSIVGDLNTKTYLKYYLGTLDSAKVVGDSKQLFELYDHLVMTQKDYAMIVVSSAQDAMEYESSIKKLNKAYNIKSFIDEKSAIKWAMNNSVKVLILEDLLKTTNAATFLKVYHNNILTRPNIILIGDKPKFSSADYTINKLLAKGISSKILAENVMIMLES